MYEDQTIHFLGNFFKWPFVPYCQLSYWHLACSLLGDSGTSFPSPSFWPSSVLDVCLSVFPNFSSSLFSFSAQAASRSSRARRSSSSLRLRALSTASDSSGDTYFALAGPWFWDWRWWSSCSGSGSPWFFCWAYRWNKYRLMRRPQLFI